MKYINTLLHEKNIELEATLLEEEGNFGLTVEMLVDYIYSLSKPTILQIEAMFRRIDFKNGDIMGYVTFLAKGMVD